MKGRMGVKDVKRMAEQDRELLTEEERARVEELVRLWLESYPLIIPIDGGVPVA